MKQPGPACLEAAPVSPARIALLYALFAAVSTAANLAGQAAAIALYGGPHAVPLSMLVGTLIGLPIKYLLEKRHIFGFETDSLAHDGRLFVLYSVMGVFTTALFWAVELAFHWAFEGDAMRYVGGALGLTLGYVIKYRLDKRYVFVARPPTVARAAGC